MEETTTALTEARTIVTQAINKAVDLLKPDRELLSKLRDSISLDLDIVTAMSLGIKLSDVSKVARKMDETTAIDRAINAVRPSLPKPEEKSYAVSMLAVKDAIASHVALAKKNNDPNELMALGLVLQRLTKELVVTATDMMEKGFGDETQRR
jgi:hypothetical protein